MNNSSAYTSALPLEREVDAKPTPLFLLSLPRSGSTLCQRILATHQEIETVNEPHILLPFFYSLKNVDVSSTYNHHYTSLAIEDFCSSLPNGADDYLAEIREFVMRLYTKSAQGEAGQRLEGKYFLDKTPKYHFVAEDILKLFPEAKVIFLWRNPLAIVASIMKTWREGGWNIYHFDVDLYQGLDRLVTTYAKYADRVHAVRYEDLIISPEETWRKVFAYLELPFDPQVLNNFSQIKLKGRVTDPHSSMEEYQVLRKEPLYKWKKTITNPLRKAWCRRYLHWIGQERFDIMGYDLHTLLAELDALPFSLEFVETDIYRMPLGAAHHLFELQMMKNKFQAWRSGQYFYMHN